MVEGNIMVEANIIVEEAITTMVDTKFFLQKETSKFLRLLIRIRSENRPKGVKLRFEYDHIAPSGFGVADQEGTDSYVLFGSNTTYV